LPATTVHGPAFAAATDLILRDPTRAAALSARAVELARGYTWSVTAARLRRLYADLSARELVRCDV
jgi:hypothetical protein